MRDPYVECPVFTTDSFTIRLVAKEDVAGLYQCYHNPTAVKFMNDDNCDFGFYVETMEQMAETIGYWIDFYKKRAFIRFSIVTSTTDEIVGTIEGFGGETGVLRVDICEEYEKQRYLSEIFNFAKDYFGELFQNDVLVTKAIEDAKERRAALTDCGWEYFGEYRNFSDYYRIEVK